MPERTRLTAMKTRIAPLTRGAYQPSQGFEPGYVITQDGACVSRVRVLGTVMNVFMSDDGNYGFLVLDDETETIRVKFFKDTKPLQSIAVGDIVDVVGKIKQYESELYVQPEIMRKIEDPNFITLRLAELVAQKRAMEQTKQKVRELLKQTSDIEELKKLAEAAGVNPDAAASIAQAADIREQPPADKKAAKDSVVAAIERLDEGSGTDYGTLVKELGLTEAQVEPIINELLTDGTCFEPRPGRIKKL